VSYKNLIHAKSYKLNPRLIEVKELLGDLSRHRSPLQDIAAPSSKECEISTKLVQRGCTTNAEHSADALSVDLHGVMIIHYSAIEDADD